MEGLIISKYVLRNLRSDLDTVSPRKSKKGTFSKMRKERQQGNTSFQHLSLHNVW